MLKLSKRSLKYPLSLKESWAPYVIKCCPLGIKSVITEIWVLLRYFFRDVAPKRWKASILCMKAYFKDLERLLYLKFWSPLNWKAVSFTLLKRSCWLTCSLKTFFHLRKTVILSLLYEFSEICVLFTKQGIEVHAKVLIMIFSNFIWGLCRGRGELKFWFFKTLLIHIIWIFWEACRVLGSEPGTLHLLGMHFTLELYPQPIVWIFVFIYIRGK